MRVLVVTNAYPTPADPALGTFVRDQVESLRALGLEIELLHIDRASRGRSAYRRLGPVLRSAVEQSRPDIVHVTYGGVLAGIVARKLPERAIVVSFCGNDLLGEGDAKLPRRLTGRYGVYCSHRAASKASGIVVKSKALQDALPQRIDKRRVWVIPSGVDIELFQPQDARESRARLAWAQDREHVLFPAATNRTEKRFDLAQAAVDQLRATGRNVELHVLDRVPRDTVPLWLNASDVVILTSTHEGSPNVIKEALACDVAVVSTDVGDVRERIAGVHGSHIAEATPDDLAAKLTLALDGGRATSRWAVADLSLPRTATRMLAVYEAVVDSTA